MATHNSNGAAPVLELKPRSATARAVRLQLFSPRSRRCTRRRPTSSFGSVSSKVPSSSACRSARWATRGRPEERRPGANPDAAPC